MDAAKNKTRAPAKPFTHREAMLTTFGLGFLRPAPGTWGSLPPLPIAALLVFIGSGSMAYHTAMVLILFVFSAACVAFGPYAATRFRRPDLPVEAKANADAPEIVADETAGQALALMGWPLLIAPQHPHSLWLMLAGIALSFFAFRAFDILKPWPCNLLEKLPGAQGGVGVLADDLMAGIYASASIALLAVVLT
ncbi:MAG: phosphatidylglycerophosphatase A [Planctomycetota bacterium]